MCTGLWPEDVGLVRTGSRGIYRGRVSDVDAQCCQGHKHKWEDHRAEQRSQDNKDRGVLVVGVAWAKVQRQDMGMVRAE